MNAKERGDAEKTLGKFGLAAKVAAMVGVNRRTLVSACDAGHVDSVALGCGQRVVAIESARVWAASDRRPGRKAST